MGCCLAPIPLLLFGGEWTGDISFGVMGDILFSVFCEACEIEQTMKIKIQMNNGYGKALMSCEYI